MALRSSFSPRFQKPYKLLGNPFAAVGALVLLATMTSCAAGDPKFAAEPAGFWAGLWHGLIMLFTFIISLFNENVRVYELANTGALYNLGFVLGAAIFFGGSSCSKKCRKKGPNDEEWKEFSEKFEAKMKKAVQKWLNESPDKEWEELAGKVEEKIKRELRKWVEK